MLQGNTIRLTENLDLSGKTARFSCESVTLDLNGHTLTVGALQVDSSATLTLTDSIGTGCIKGSINVNGDSTLVLNGGTVTSTEESTLGGTIKTGTGTTAFNGPVKTSSKTTISGGVFNGKVSALGSISGGVFYGYVPTSRIEEGYYTVTFDLNGGSGSIHEQLFVNTDTATAMKPADPTRDGYAFLGWYKSGESDPYDFSSPVTSSFTLEAHWQSYGYKIDYVPNVGTLPTSYPTGYATGIAATLPTPTRTGFTFDGWYTNADLTGGAVTQIDTGTTGDKEFYAKWTENLPTGGGSAKAPSSASKPVGVPKTGDESMVVLWLTLASVSALGLGYVTLRKRKN